MADNLSLRARLMAMEIGEMLVISKTEYAPLGRSGDGLPREA